MREVTEVTKTKNHLSNQQTLRCCALLTKFAHIRDESGGNDQRNSTLPSSFIHDESGASSGLAKNASPI
jgi:hypothetical protein